METASVHNKFLIDIYTKIVIVLLNIFVETVLHFYRNLWWIESSKELQDLKYNYFVTLYISLLSLWILAECVFLSYWPPTFDW